ncbi:BrnT family toxin [Gluconobacter sp.]|uniref:BrnT family toxin n=1 Tax=Gluconobacter sp. TaxID=1876758 RepID=UPI0039ED9632
MGRHQAPEQHRASRCCSGAEGFEWDAAFIQASQSSNEPRLIALGPIGDRLHVLVFSIETRTVRIISLRKANKREGSLYVSQD